jgi:hypothetical protein
MKGALVATKDNHKIADVIVEAERNDDYDWYYYQNFGQKIYNYNQVVYLKFNDNTLIEAEVYFGDGFDKLIDKFKELLEEFGFDVDDF